MDGAKINQGRKSFESFGEEFRLTRPDRHRDNERRGASKYAQRGSDGGELHGDAGGDVEGLAS